MVAGRQESLEPGHGPMPWNDRPSGAGAPSYRPAGEGCRRAGPPRGPPGRRTSGRRRRRRSRARRRRRRRPPRRPRTLARSRTGACRRSDHALCDRWRRGCGSARAAGRRSARPCGRRRRRGPARSAGRSRCGTRRSVVPSGAIVAPRSPRASGVEAPSRVDLRPDLVLGSWIDCSARIANQPGNATAR